MLGLKQKGAESHTEPSPNTLAKGLYQLGATVSSILHQLGPQLVQRNPSHALIVQRGVGVGIEFLVPRTLEKGFRRRGKLAIRGEAGVFGPDEECAHRGEGRDCDALNGFGEK